MGAQSTWQVWHLLFFHSITIDSGKKTGLMAVIKRLHAILYTDKKENKNFPNI
jgi:hypothetical protein